MYAYVYVVHMYIYVYIYINYMYMCIIVGIYTNDIIMVDIIFGELLNIELTKLVNDSKAVFFHRVVNNSFIYFLMIITTNCYYQY